jgi:RNA 3'-terminal phosphate cyclase (ATP)
MVELDGSLGEGGGQILRTALALSLITGKAFRLKNIRAKRPKPGLMRQHLACVHAAVAVGGGADKTLAVNQDGQAVQIGETTLTFTPGKINAGDYEFAIGSAGSCMLVLQTVLWPLLMADQPSQLLLRGGTHNPMAPSFAFLEQVLPRLWGDGAPWVTMVLRRHGFYPAGGGEVLVQTMPPAGGLQRIDLMQRGALRQAYAQCLHGGIPKGLAERELAALASALGWRDEQLHNRALRANEGPGNALVAVLQYQHITEVFASFGEKGVSAEQVASQVVQAVRDYQAHSAPVGPHWADQLMIPLALAAVYGDQSKGGGQYFATELTEHARTNAWVIEGFLPVKFGMRAHEGGFVMGLSLDI